MCIRDRVHAVVAGLDQRQAVMPGVDVEEIGAERLFDVVGQSEAEHVDIEPVSYTHLRAHETVLDLVCRLLLEKKKKQKTNNIFLKKLNKNRTTTTKTMNKDSHTKHISTVNVLPRH